MKKLFLFIAITIFTLAALLPFASTTPDGLEELVQSSADQQQQPFWNGLMADYSISIDSSYFSTLVAGIFGTSIVLAAGYAIGAGMKTKKKSEISNSK